MFPRVFKLLFLILQKMLLVFDNYCTESVDFLGRMVIFIGLIPPMGFPGGASIKNLLDNARDVRDASSIPGSGRFSGGGHGNSLQYSCLENPMDRGACQAT